MRSVLHRSAARFAVWLGLVALLLEADARAARRIVYLGFTGVRGAHATRTVARFLSGRFDLVSRGRFAKEARRRGLSPGSANGRSVGARAVRAVAVVAGQVARSGGLYSLRVTVYSADDGQAVGHLSYPLHGMRLDLLTARRVANGIVPAVARARPGAPLPPAAGTEVAAAPAPRARPSRAVAPRPEPPEPVPARPPPVRPARQPSATDTDNDSAPEPPEPAGAVEPKQEPAKQATTFHRHATTPPEQPPRVANKSAQGDNLGFDVPDGAGVEPNDGTAEDRPPPRRRSRNGDATQIRKPSGARADWEKIVELSLGLMLLNRTFDFNDPIEPRNPRNYRSGMVPAILIDAGLYPLAFFGHNPLGNLGMICSYYRVPVLRSKVEGVETDTTLDQLELGLRYRWNILGRASSPVIRAGLSFGRMDFEIQYGPDLYKIPLPNITYLYLKLALAQLEVPFFTRRSFAVGGLLYFDYLHVFSAGDIERTDSGGYGDSTTGGIDLGGGLYVTVAGFFAKVTGFYRRMFYAFDGSCYDDQLGCNAAGGALDIYRGVTMTAGYAY